MSLYTILCNCTVFTPITILITVETYSVVISMVNHISMFTACQCLNICAAVDHLNFNFNFNFNSALLLSPHTTLTSKIQEQNQKR